MNTATKPFRPHTPSLFERASNNAAVAFLDAMSPAQAAYLLARAEYDAAIAESNARTSGMPTATDEEFEAWNDACEEARSVLGIDRLSNLLAVAEEALLAWSFKVARKTAAGDRAALATIDYMEANLGLPLHLTTRRKAVDIALRLAV